MLWAKQTQKADLVLRGARVLDPAGGVDATVDVRIDGGTIAAIGHDVDAKSRCEARRSPGTRKGIVRSIADAPDCRLRV